MSELDVQREIRAISDKLERLRKADAGGLPSGTSFPASPTTDFLFYRTDLGFVCYYDGTRWLTVQEFACVVTIADNITVSFAATTAAVRTGMLRNDYAPYFTRATLYIQTGATNNAGNYFTYNLVTNTGTTIAAFNTGSDPAASNVAKVITGFTQPGAACVFLQLDMVVAVGAPSAQNPRNAVVFYRLVVT